jgi:polysaccharide export outer membrane protein
MYRIVRNVSRRRAAGIGLCVLLGAACSAILPGSAHALGGPQPITVFVEGAVRRPGNYTLPPRATLSALLSAAGGFTDNADIRGAILARNSARASQEAELRMMSATLSTEAATSQPARKVALAVLELFARLHPSGRIPVKLTYPRLLKNSPQDLPLAEGDVLRIPTIVNTVAVSGAVRASSGQIPFVPAMPYGEYIRRAGGYADDADRGEVFLLRADGTTALLSLGFISWNPDASRWEVTAMTGGPPAVGPGDTIVVPKALPPGLPKKFARKLPGILMRAAEIAGAPVLLP